MKTREDLEKESIFLISQINQVVNQINDKTAELRTITQQCEQMSNRLAEIEWLLNASEKNRS